MKKLNRIIDILLLVLLLPLGVFVCVSDWISERILIG